MIKVLENGMFVYIMTNRPDGTLYIGVTNDLVRRAYEHRLHLAPGFTDRYNLTRLVHFETFADPLLAFQRERNLKRWYRKWKVELINTHNPGWRDLWDDIAHP